MGLLCAGYSLYPRGTFLAAEPRGIFGDLPLFPPAMWAIPSRGTDIVTFARKFIACNLRNTQFHVVTSSSFYIMSIVLHTAESKISDHASSIHLLLRFKNDGKL